MDDTLPVNAPAARPAALSRIRVLVNQASGSVAGGEAMLDLAESFSRHGIAAEIERVPPDAIERKVQEALEQARAGCLDAIVIGGGDGTIGAAAGVLAGSGIPLGLLPLGTLNHFAQDLGLPLDLQGAVAAIAAGAVRRVDLAEVNGRVFINNSSIGLYAEMVANRDRIRKQSGWSKWTAMLLAAWRVVRRYRLRRLAIRAEGWTDPCRTPFVFVGNNAYQMDLFNAGKRAALDRGELLLYVIKTCSRWGVLRLVLHALTGRLDQQRDFEMRSVSELEIRSKARRLRVALDGEITKLQPPLFYRIRPQSLLVLAPSAT